MERDVDRVAYSDLPAGSRVVVERTGEGVRVEFPAVGVIVALWRQWWLVALLAAISVWSAAYLLPRLLKLTYFPTVALFPLAVFILGPWLLVAVVMAVEALVGMEMRLMDDQLVLIRRAGRFTHRSKLRREEITGVQVHGVSVRLETRHWWRFASVGVGTQVEAKWLAAFLRWELGLEK